MYDAGRGSLYKEGAEGPGCEPKRDDEHTLQTGLSQN